MRDAIRRTRWCHHARAGLGVDEAVTEDALRLERDDVEERLSSNVVAQEADDPRGDFARREEVVAALVDGELGTRGRVDVDHRLCKAR